MRYQALTRRAAQSIEFLQNFARNASRGERGSRRLEHFAHLMHLRQPMLRAFAYDRALIFLLLEKPVRY